jgi:hypothetical protein
MVLDVVGRDNTKETSEIDDIGIITIGHDTCISDIAVQKIPRPWSFCVLVAPCVVSVTPQTMYKHNAV